MRGGTERWITAVVQRRPSSAGRGYVGAMDGVDSADGAQQAAPARRHTRRQRLVRTLFYFFGPAQNGPPPYATPEELRMYEGGTRSSPAPDSSAPRGFEVREHTDSDGAVHRYLVESTPLASRVDGQSADLPLNLNRQE